MNIIHNILNIQDPWVESAIFWIEGVATPGISIGGLLGTADKYDDDGAYYDVNGYDYDDNVDGDDDEDVNGDDDNKDD